MDEIPAAEYAGITAAMCPGAAMDDYDLHRVEPFQVFDNLYYIGMDNISAWAQPLRACTREVLSQKRAAAE